MEEKIVEGKLSLRFELPASLKVQFEEKCRLENKSMTEVVVELISKFVA